MNDVKLKTMYNEIIERIKQGARFSVDFKKKELKINGKAVSVEGSLGIKKYDNLDEWLDDVEDLYDEYKYSKPTQRSMEKERKSRFKALSPGELLNEFGHNALSNPLSRDVAQAKLEIFILFSMVNGSFNPDELFAKDWYYQGADKSFIMLKNWFINN